MITTSKEKDFPAAKQEGGPAGEEKQLYKALSASSRQWSSARFHNPRIVRVSRTFGGKDRHSKVCTVRGLRDRRIRLSVPTAVQLYDLQDRLGLSQPSKVIDWLIDAAKQDIDKLPPLQIPRGVLGQFLHHPNIHDHHHLNLIPHHDYHHHQAKTNEQDQFVQKFFGNMSSTASYMSTTHHENPDPTTSLLGHGISLPGGQHFDGLGHGNLVMSTNPSTTPSSFNPASIQSVPQLFFCAPPPPPPPPLSNSTASLFGTPYPPYISISHENNPHYTIRSQMINNHIQLLSGSSSITTSTSSSSLPSSQQCHNHHHHVLNNSLMSSFHDITNSNINNDENRAPLMKSFPAILNQRQLFVQSHGTSAAYENRPETDRSTAD